VAVRAMFAGRATVVPGVLAKMMNAAMVFTPRPVIRFVQNHSDWLPRPS
jgi:hypothetical protein